MKKLFKTFSMLLAAAAVMTATSCSDDLGKEIGNEAGQDPMGDGVYMAFSVQMPTKTGSRSQTVTPGQSTDDVEIGKDFENNVSDILVVLAKPSDNSLILATTVSANNNNSLTHVANNGASSESYKATVMLQKSNLSSFYKGLGSDAPDVNVYVFCNPTNDLKALTNEPGGNNTWVDKVWEYSATQASIWEPKKFLMNNVAQAVRSLPRTLNDWNAYKTAATAFNLSGMNAEGQDVEVDNRNGRGAIKVERSCARFDFKDGSPVGNNTYNVVLDSDKKTLIQIRLNKMFFTNLAKQFYYLPRVSANGLNAEAVICGEETPENYVVGPFATAFSSEDIKTGFEFSNYFQYSFFNNSWGYNNANWDKYLISEVLKDGNAFGTEEDNKDIYMNHQYHIWRYATENVIPGDVDNQVYGRTSIIVFKGKMIATEDALNSSDPDTKEMAEYMNNVGGDKLGNTQKDPILYSFRNSLYFKWEGVQKSAIKDAITMTDNLPKTIGTYEEDGIEYLIVDPTTISRTSSLYIAVFGKRINGEDKAGAIGKFQWGTTWYIDDPAKTIEGGDLTVLTNSANVVWTNWDNAGRPDNTLLTSMRKAITDSGFTIYQTSNDEADGWGYYCYYYYRNRHNDNGDNGVMGPMEFAVVRNNVYKLAVTEISQLGHPRIPENDPDNPDPNTPDESDDIYLTVSCEVVPWVVRVNDIKF